MAAHRRIRVRGQGRSHIEAPASMAARAIPDSTFVSIEITSGLSARRPQRAKAGGWALRPVNFDHRITRPISSSAPSISAPGRVDSPPMSMIVRASAKTVLARARRFLPA